VQIFHCKATPTNSPGFMPLQSNSIQPPPFRLPGRFPHEVF
jgi:hypothetical protein